MEFGISINQNATLFNDIKFEDYIWFSNGVLVLLLRAGFVLIQISCVPNNNVNKLVFQNLADVGISTALYVCIGYVLAFGEDIAGVVGAPKWIPVQEMLPDLAVLGWSTVMVSGAIFTAAIAGRISVLGQLMSSAMLAGLVQPVVLHWVRSDSGWLWGYRDQGGAATVHASGGMAALIGTAFLGRRLLLLRELDECSLPPSSPGNIFTGYILVMLGLLALSHPRTALLNNMAAAGGAALAIAVLQKAMGSKRLDYWKVVTCFQGAVAGIVTVASGLDLYHPSVALALGTFGAMICHIVTRLCSLCYLEDYINLVPVHLICGVLSTICPPLHSPVTTSDDLGMQIAWQLLGVLAIIGLTAAALVPLFFVMTWCTILRDETETRNHLRAVRVADSNTPIFWLGRIFRTHTGLPQLRPGYRAKDVKAYLEGAQEEVSTQCEVRDMQGAGEPSEAAQFSEDPRPQEGRPLDASITFSNEPTPLKDRKHHMAVLGREPTAIDVQKENSLSSILQDSSVELVECGTPDNLCSSQKLHQVCYMNIDQKHPTTFSVHKLPHGSVMMYDCESAALLDQKDTPSRKTRRQTTDFQKMFSFLIDEMFEQDKDKNPADKLDETLNLESALQMTRKFTEDEQLKLEDKYFPLEDSTISEIATDADRECL